eukprot:1250163-Alexandrium_andersonii.AAC.1
MSSAGELPLEAIRRHRSGAKYASSSRVLCTLLGAVALRWALSCQGNLSDSRSARSPGLSGSPQGADHRAGLRKH